MMDVLTLIGLGITDALNPFSIAAMAYLLATDRPFERGLVFIIGTLAIYLPGGIALMEGWSAILKNILPTLPDWLTILMYLVFGLVCLAVAFHFYRQAKKNSEQTAPKLSNLSLTATFIFALGSTISDLPTALPFFAAANIIAGLSDAFVYQLSLLILYNFIYVSPLILMLAIRMSAGAKAQIYLTKVRQGVDWSFVHCLPPAIAALGIYLLARGCWLIGGIT
jgi:cytochrome c biogenesis protein CcdA